MNNKKILNALKILAVPTAYALVLRLFFDVNTWSSLYRVMSISFLICLPTIVGALTIYFSKIEDVRSLAYRVFVPWIPVILFLIITLIFAIEGWACWIMVLPLFFAFASVGGLIGGYLKLKKKKTNFTYLF